MVKIDKSINGGYVVTTKYGVNIFTTLKDATQFTIDFINSVK